MRDHPRPDICEFRPPHPRPPRPLRGFRLQCTVAGRNLLLDTGVSLEFGARELKRTVQRNFIQPVAALVAQRQIPPASTVILDAKAGSSSPFCSANNQWTELRADFFAHLTARVLLQFPSVRVKLSDSFAQLIRCHSVLIVHPAELLLVQMDPLSLTGLGSFRR